MSEQNVKNVPGIGRVISKKLTSIDRATPNIIAFESRLVTIEQQVNNIDLASKLDINDFNGNNILNNLITVDGTGSGLDADMLDGHEATYFAPNAHDHDSRYYEKSIADSTFLGTHDKADDSTLFDGNAVSFFAPQATTYTKTEVDNLIDNTGFTESLATDGWCELPNGLIMQWGKALNQKTPTVNFPKIFPHACLNCQVSQFWNASDSKYTARVRSVSTSTAQFEWGDIYPTGADLFWFAIGY